VPRKLANDDAVRVRPSCVVRVFRCSRKQGDEIPQGTRPLYALLERRSKSQASPRDSWVIAVIPCRHCGSPTELPSGLCDACDRDAKLEREQMASKQHVRKGREAKEKRQQKAKGDK
jgi:hypothetical protein